MARRTQLATLLAMVRREARHSDSVALGRNARSALIQHIVRVQDQLWLDHDWPHMLVNRDIALAAGQRYYDFPADLEFERVRSAHARTTGGKWVPIGYGIGADEYNQHDSDADARSDPVLRWQYNADETDNGDQIEVWPLPSGADQTLRLRGIRKLGPLIADTDVAELDDQMLATMVAAEILAHEGAKDAQAKLAAGVKLFRKLTGRMSKSKMFVMGGCIGEAPRSPEIRTVYNDRTP